MMQIKTSRFSAAYEKSWTNYPVLQVQRSNGPTSDEFGGLQSPKKARLDSTMNMNMTGSNKNSNKITTIIMIIIIIVIYKEDSCSGARISNFNGDSSENTTIERTATLGHHVSNVVSGHLGIQPRYQVSLNKPIMFTHVFFFLHNDIYIYMYTLYIMYIDTHILHIPYHVYNVI